MGGLTSSALFALGRKLDQLRAFHLGAGGKLEDAPAIAQLETYNGALATVRTGDRCFELEYRLGEWRFA